MDPKNNIVEVLRNDFVWSVPIEKVVEILALHHDPGYSGSPWDQISDRLTERLLAGPDADKAAENIQLVSAGLAATDPEFLVSFLSRIVQRQKVQQASSLVEQAINHLPQGTDGKSLLSPVLETTLSLWGQLGHPENRRLLFSLSQ